MNERKMPTADLLHGKKREKTNLILHTCLLKIKTIIAQYENSSTFAWWCKNMKIPFPLQRTRNNTEKTYEQNTKKT